MIAHPLAAAVNSLLSFLGPDTLEYAVNPGIGKCGRVCGDRVRRQNPPGNNVTNFTKSHDFNETSI